MIDINAEAEKSLLKTGLRVYYVHPDKDAELPCVSFYMLTENGAFSYDNSEAIQRGTVRVNMWANNPKECGDMFKIIYDTLTADGWVREMSRDIPDSDCFHKTSSFIKDFIKQEE